MQLSEIDIEAEFDKFLGSKGYVSTDQIAEGDITEFVNIIFKMTSSA